MKAILLISHGSHSPKTKKEVALLIEQMKASLKGRMIQFAFLEIEQPSIPDGIDQCVREGAKEILVLLNFLNSGKHVDEDIPRIVKEAAAKHAEVRFKISNPVGQHPNIVGLFLDMI